MNTGVILFYSSSSAMKAEAVFSRAAIEVKLVPTPRELSSDCGVSLRFNARDIAAVNKVIEKARLDYTGIHISQGVAKLNDN